MMTSWKDITEATRQLMDKPDFATRVWAAYDPDIFVSYVVVEDECGGVSASCHQKGKKTEHFPANFHDRATAQEACKKHHAVLAKIH